MEAERPGPTGLCPTCAHARRVTTPRSVFLLCQRSRDDARFERYPRQPVRECPGHEPAGDGEAPPGTGPDGAREG